MSIGKSPVNQNDETNSPTAKSMTPSEGGSNIFQEQHGLLQKLNELAIIPSKVKYQFDELKD